MNLHVGGQEWKDGWQVRTVQPPVRTDRKDHRLVVMAAGTMHVAVLEFLGGGLTHTDDLHVEM